MHKLIFLISKQVILNREQMSERWKWWIWRERERMKELKKATKLLTVNLTSL